MIMMSRIFPRIKRKKKFLLMRILLMGIMKKLKLRI